MPRDRDTFNAAWRRWYAKNAKRKQAWQTRRRRELRAWWLAIKATKRCVRCGETAAECLHFHHLDPTTKKFEVSVGVGQGWSRKLISAEMAKCIVLCANCHLIHHWDERHGTESSG